MPKQGQGLLDLWQNWPSGSQMPQRCAKQHQGSFSAKYNTEKKVPSRLPSKRLIFSSSFLPSLISWLHPFPFKLCQTRPTLRAHTLMHSFVLTCVYASTASFYVCAPQPTNEQRTTNERTTHRRATTATKSGTWREIARPTRSATRAGPRTTR